MGYDSVMYLGFFKSGDINIYIYLLVYYCLVFIYYLQMLLYDEI